MTISWTPEWLSASQKEICSMQAATDAIWAASVIIFAVHHPTRVDHSVQNILHFCHIAYIHYFLTANILSFAFPYMVTSTCLLLPPSHSFNILLVLYMTWHSDYKLSIWNNVEVLTHNLTMQKEQDNDTSEHFTSVPSFSAGSFRHQ